MHLPSSSNDNRIGNACCAPTWVFTILLVKNYATYVLFAERLSFISAFCFLAICFDCSSFAVRLCWVIICFSPSFPTSLVSLASLFYNFFIVWAVVLIVQMIVVSVSFSFFHQQLLFWAGLNESGINFGINISSHTCEELACKCMESVLRLISTKP